MTDQSEGQQEEQEEDSETADLNKSFFLDPDLELDLCEAEESGRATSHLRLFETHSKDTEVEQSEEADCVLDLQRLSLTGESGQPRQTGGQTTNNNWLCVII